MRAYRGREGWMVGCKSFKRLVRASLGENKREAPSWEQVNPRAVAGEGGRQAHRQWVVFVR